MIEKGIRGGMADVTHRYAKANKKYLPDYDETKPNYLMYLDANNLYNFTCKKVCQYLSYKSCTSNILKQMPN
ncbi:unnamed protein product [Ixodes hexagonus]